MDCLLFHCTPCESENPVGKPGPKRSIWFPYRISNEGDIPEKKLIFSANYLNGVASFGLTEEEHIQLYKSFAQG